MRATGALGNATGADLESVETRTARLQTKDLEQALRLFCGLAAAASEAAETGGSIGAVQLLLSQAFNGAE